MAASLAVSGSNLAIEIANTLSPKNWKKINYGYSQYYEFEVNKYSSSSEYFELRHSIREAQDYFGVEYYDNITHVDRIQNPYSYARFVLRKKHLILKYGMEAVEQVRRFKLIPEKYVYLALKYNCDARRFGRPDADYRFYDQIPEVWKCFALIVVQVLTVKTNNYEENYQRDRYNFADDYYNDNNSEYEGEHSYDSNNECNRDSEFYIEYVVYF